MSDAGLYVVYIIISLIIASLAVIGSYGPPYTDWLRFKFAMAIFTKEPEFEGFIFMLERFKYRYLSAYFVMGIISYGSYGVFLWVSWILFQTKFFIPEMIILFFSLLAYYFEYRNLWKKLKRLGVETKEAALISFENHRQKIKIDKVKSFQLFKYNINDKSKNKLSIYNLPLQHNQKRIAKITKRLVKKKKHLSQKKYDFKVLLIYIGYLRRHGTFFNWIENSVNNNITDQYVVIENENYQDVNVLKKVLINNFFAFVAAAEAAE